MQHPILIAVVGALLTGSFAYANNQTVVRLSEPVFSSARYEVFGASTDYSAEPISLSELLAEPDRHIGQTRLIEAQGGKGCQKKGCFFVAQQGGVTARVSFKDYGFFIPTDSAGKTLTLSGELIQLERTPAQAKHFAEDAGSAESLQAGPTY